MKTLQRLKREPAWLYILAGLLVAVFVAAGSYMLVTGRSELMQQSRDATANLELAIREDVLHTLEHYDTSMQATADISQRQDVRDLPANVRQFAIFDASTTAPERGWVLILDAKGSVRFDSRTTDVAQRSFAQREYFQVHARKADVGIFVSRPMYSRSRATWFIGLSRRIEAADGSFGGVVLATIRLTYFQQLFDKLTIGKYGTVFLIRDDGILLARTSESLAVVGDNISAGMIFQRIKVAPVDYYTAPSPHYGSWKSYTHTKLDSFPVYLSVAIDISTPFRAWIKKAVIIAAIVLMLIIAVFGLTFLWRNRENDLRVQFLRFRTALNTMPYGVCMFDAHRKLVVCNRRYLDLYGLNDGQIKIGMSLQSIVEKRGERLPLSNQSSNDYFQERLALVNGSVPDTRLYHYESGDIISVSHEGIEGGGWVSTHEDVTERIRHEAEITRLANYDSLTGLPNRACVWQALETAMANPNKASAVSLLYLDLDGFKMVNDSFGHSVGDLFLQDAANRLQSCVREGDILARLGGDEFAILVSSRRPYDAATALARRVLAAFAQPALVENYTASLGVSIGIALSQADGHDAETLFKNADIALYQAKGDGRGRFCFFKPESKLRMLKRLEMEADLRSAIANEELELAFQPLVDLQSGAPTCFEALLRWNHPHLGMVSPVTFIPIAEETGLIVTIGDWVLRKACMAALNWPSHVRVAVNLSTVQFRENAIARSVELICAETGLDPHRLELEVTESVLARDEKAVRATLQEFRTMGIRTALDDFGTGYSSLSYLRTFPFDKLKIDKSFVSEMSCDGGSSVIVRAVIGLGRSLGLEVTAEGIETVEQLRLLLTEGCGQGQGYLFGRPMSASAVDSYLAGLGAHNNAEAA